MSWNLQLLADPRLTVLEKLAWHLLQHGPGNAVPTATHLATWLGCPEEELTTLCAHLRDHGYPVCSPRSNDPEPGYFLYDHPLDRVYREWQELANQAQAG